MYTAPTFDPNSDYKAHFECEVTKIQDLKIEDVKERIIAIESLIEKYVSTLFETPDSYQLTRLTNLILAETLKNTNPGKDKSILSKQQVKRRKNREEMYIENKGEKSVSRRTLRVEEDVKMEMDRYRKDDLI